ncbi:MAG: glutamate--cysteine ligase [Pseudomonadota bacterium]
MKSQIESIVSQLRDAGASNVLSGRRIGLEKESLRVDPNGVIAQTDHPRALGSALTHSAITTDYSEALLEMVTPAFGEMRETLGFLDETHRFIFQNLDDEILWSTSMPCVLDGDASIPIAEYGSSNAATMKTTYRRGLGHRYGRVMQAIAGIHYNYSYPESFWELLRDIKGSNQDLQTFVSESYIGMIRNLHRYGWLVPYLFGASPAICRSFLGSAETPLDELFEHSYYGPYATSLRMGDIGYQNAKEGELGIRVDYSSLGAYVESLSKAINTSSEQYKQFGLEKNGEWQQLNFNVLQIENEHYSTVRPKQILRGEEKPTLALAKRGVAYIELRSLDVNVFEPLGISEEHMRFLESFLLFSLVAPSPPLPDYEQLEVKANFNSVAFAGRDPKLQLQRNGESIGLRTWAEEIFDYLSLGCDLLDAGREHHIYCSALQQQRAKIKDPDRTPSARILNEMMQNKEEFFEFSLRYSEQHRSYFKSRPLDHETESRFEEMAIDSLDKQRKIEAADTLSFDEFLHEYFSQT